MKFKKKILPNGLRMITVPMADNPTVTVLVLVETGSNKEWSLALPRAHVFQGDNQPS
ncbi:MAG: hypothetical protein ACYCZ7_02515 [Minisyncoccota bacterium]